MIPIIPIDLNVTLNTNVCTVCLTVYNDINDLFFLMTRENKQGICMDVIDTVRERMKVFISIY
jgi:hypothetical protein